MPRRQSRAVPPWRRGRQQPAARPVQLTGRSARAFAREYAKASQQAPRKNGTAASNDALATTRAWRFRRHMPPFVWGGGLAVAGAILHAAPHPLLFGILAGAGAPVLLVWSTRHLSRFAKRGSEAAAVITSLWLPVLAALGFTKPIPALLALTWAPCLALWVRHYRWRPAPPELVPEAVVDTSDEAVWQRLATRRRWSGHLTGREDIPGGRKYQIQLDGIETHIGQVIAEPRTIAAAWHKPQTEAYVEPHPTGVESRGTLTLLKAGTLQGVHEWDGSGFSEKGIARIGRFADSQPVRIRAWVPRDGTRHGLIAGCMGSGKTETLNLLIWLALTSPVPIVPVILDPQNGQSLPQWRGKVLYAAGVEECARMIRGLHAGMMDRSKRLASMVWDDDGHKAKGMEFFDPHLTGLPIVMTIIDEAPLLLSGDGNAKLAAEMVRLNAAGAKLARKTGDSRWPVAQVPSLSELGDQSLRSMLVGGNVICLRTGDRVSGGMVGLEADPSALPKFFPDGEPTSGLGYAVTMDNRQAPMRGDLVPSRMRHQAVEVPALEDDYLEAMDRAMGAQGVLLPSGPVAEPAPADDAPEGRRCIDAVWQVLSDRGAEMNRGEIIGWVNDLAKDMWGRDKPFSIRAISDALRDLVDGKSPGRTVTKPRDGVYRAAAPSRTAGNDPERGAA